MELKELYYTKPVLYNSTREVPQVVGVIETESRKIFAKGWERERKRGNHDLLIWSFSLAKGEGSENL